MPLLKPLAALVGRRLQIRVAVSEAARETGLRSGGGDFEVLFNGVDMARFESAAPVRDEQGRPVVLFLGRHEGRKGLNVLLDAFATLDRPAVLWVAGDGPGGEMQRRRHPGSDRVHWLGMLSEDEVASRLAGADVLCAPSLHGESFGMVLLEGMAAGCAVVASDIEGYRAAAGGHAELVPPDDATRTGPCARGRAGRCRRGQRALGARGAQAGDRVRPGLVHGRAGRALRRRVQAGHRRLRDSSSAAPGLRTAHHPRHSVRRARGDRERMRREWCGGHRNSAAELPTITVARVGHRLAQTRVGSMLFRLNLYDFTLVGFIQLFLATALLLSPARRYSRRWNGSRFSEVLFSSSGALAVAVPACWLVSVIWGIPFSALELPMTAVMVIAVIVVVARPDCNPVGQIFSAAYIAAGLGLILFTIKITTTNVNGGFQLVVSGFFVLLSVFAVTLWNSYVNATSDVLGRFRHSRSLPEADPSYQPFVSLHIAAYNEPPDMLIETIKRAEAIEYPHFEIVVIDNNTKDPAVWRPVEEYCRDRPRVTFVHVDPWPGFKAGALNLALRRYTDERAEIIGLIDADDFVVPHYLKETAPYFSNERIGFLQSFEGNRDYEGSPYYSACVDSYQAFYLTNMSSRNQRDSIPFVGTMGLFRRSALEQAGGWNEWCICEDTEASVRVLKLGWSGLYVPRCFGRGVVPPSYAGLCTQRYRWCFGGMQILRLHWRSLMPWDRSPDNRLSSQQRRDYLMASLGWMRDLVMVLFTIALFATTALLLSGADFWVLPIASGISLLGISLIAIALLSMLWVFRQWTNMSRRRTLMSLVISLASSWTIALACVQGLARREGVFLRTPKNDRSEKVVQRLRSALWLARWEMAFSAGLFLCAGLLAASSSKHILLVVMICVQACVFVCAPVTAFWNVRAQMVPAADRQRRLAAERARPSVRGRRSFVGAGVALAMVALVGAVAAASVTAPGELLAGGTAPRIKTAAQIDAPPAGAPAVAPPFVEVTGTPGGGWLEITADGTVWAGGGANYFGDLQHRPDAQPIAVSDVVQVRPTPDGFGYWLVGSDGSVYSFGDAPYFGSLPGLGLHVSDIVGLIPFSSGDGYELVSAVEQVWKFGDGKP